MAQMVGFPAFIIVSLAIQLAATVAVSSTWMAFNGHWRTGFIFASAPRFLIALMNLQMALVK